MRPEWVVVNWLDRLDKDYLFWSNEDGWGDINLATCFVYHDIYNRNLPIGGAWVMKAFAEKLIDDERSLRD
jgi:hypothetical protein